MITFNKPYLSGNELKYIEDAIKSGKTSGNKIYTQKCHQYFQSRYNFKKALLTTSCTDALEMIALLIDLKEGDEVIMPSYTFTSTSNAFILRGAHVVFADSSPNHPNIDADQIEQLITDKTKAIVVVHYSGIACDMDKIMALAEKHDLIVIEDAAQAIESFHNNRPLGGIGHFGAFSFHETKNIICGEGGLLIINDEKYSTRAEIIWEKGTNRSAFFRGEVDKYGWVDLGSSFLPSDLLAAFLFAQLENLEDIQDKRVSIWEKYYTGLRQISNIIDLPTIPDYATNNAHLFYIITNSIEERDDLIIFLKSQGVHSVFHYLSLHKSPFYQNQHDGRELPNCDKFSNRLLRLPMYYELTDDDLEHIISAILRFYAERQ